MPTPTKSKVVEQPIKKIIPEFNITQQKQQQQQNEQEQEEILRAGKRPESYEKRVVDPFKQKLEKNNVVLTLPTTPSPKLFGNTYPFEQKPERNSETTTTLPLSAVVTTTADSSRVKPFVPKAESVMDARVAKKSWKKARLQKQFSENTEKMNVIKKQKLSQKKYILFVE